MPYNGCNEYQHTHKDGVKSIKELSEDYKRLSPAQKETYSNRAVLKRTVEAISDKKRTSKKEALISRHKLLMEELCLYNVHSFTIYTEKCFIDDNQQTNVNYCR